VSVINLVCEDSIEHRIQHLVQAKQALADGVLDGHGDLDQLKMPSSRAGRVEQMAAMIERTETPAAEAPDPARTFAETAGQHLDRALVAVARCRNGDGQETALIVVDDVPDDSARRALDDAATAAGFAGVRVLDRTSWETIRQLADAGVLQFAGEVETLHANNGSDAAAAEADEAARRRVTARPWLETSDRKLRMAEHLAGGGFEAEAVDPLRAAAAAAVRAIALMRDRDVEGDGLDEQDALDLAERPSVSAELPAGTAAALGSSETSDSDEIAALRTKVRAVVAAARAAVGESASAGANRKQGRVQSAA
jgi:hypothetical protein